MQLFNHLAPATLSAAAAAAVTQTIVGASLGVVTSLFYSAIFHLLSTKTEWSSWINHSIVSLTCASLAFVGIPFSILVSAILVNIIFRVLFQKPFLKWPEIGLQEHEKNQIEEFIKLVLAKGVIPPSHRKNQSFGWEGREWKLPVTLSFILETGKIKAVLLMTNKILGQGRQRAAKLCYELLSGQKLVKKRAESEEEVKLLQSLNGTTGIEPLKYVRRASGKVQLITPLFQGTLKQLLEKKPQFSAKEVRGMMLSLLTGIEKLHQTTYHSDIKPSNILYKGYDLVISDGGSIGSTALWGAPSWMSPSKVRAWYEGVQDVAAYCKENGAKDDIWSLGLIFGSLLQSRLLSNGKWTETAPFTCITKCLFGYEDDSKLSEISQLELDQEIEEIKSKNPTQSPLWDIVKGMLTIAAERRLTAHAALKALQTMRGIL